MDAVGDVRLIETRRSEAQGLSALFPEGSFLRPGSLGSRFRQKRSHREMLLGGALKVDCRDATEARGATD